jgi:hypothetical protein
MPNIQKRKKEWMISFELPKKKNENIKSWVVNVLKEKKLFDL